MYIQISIFSTQNVHDFICACRVLGCGAGLEFQTMNKYNEYITNPSNGNRIYFLHHICNIFINNSI